jgi:hypothetical protein
MGFCKGNQGHLLQHWVLIETLGAIEQEFSKDHLLFAASHAMAPWSVPCRQEREKDYARQLFDHARTHLGREDATKYEQIWHRQANKHGLPYPSSAVFAIEAWPSQLSLLLCETAPTIVAEI